MNTTEIMVHVTCGFLIVVCSIECILYFLIAKDFIEDYMEDRKNDSNEETS